MRRYAPILQDIAGRLSGEPPSTLRTDPMRWAYALRDAVELAEPDVVVSHLDDRLEADAVLGAGGPRGDWTAWLAAVPPLATTAPTAAAVELVATLAGIYRSAADPAVAATLTGPATLAAWLAPYVLPPEAGEDDRIDLAELAADLLAALARAYADAGAEMLIVIERDSTFLTVEDARSAVLEPIGRAAAHRRVELVVARPGNGIGADVWSLPADEFADAWERAIAEAPDLVLSEGAVPEDIPLANLRRGCAADAT